MASSFKQGILNLFLNQMKEIFYCKMILMSIIFKVEPHEMSQAQTLQLILWASFIADV